MNRLDGPEFFRWMALRRVRRGGLTRSERHYYDQGRPVSGLLIPDLVDALIEHDGAPPAGQGPAGAIALVRLTTEATEVIEARWATS